MARKSDFKTVETDLDELEEKIRKHRRKIAKRIIIVVAAVVALFLIVWLWMALRTYKSFDVKNSVEQKDKSAVSFVDFCGAVVEYSNDGVLYTDSDGNRIWNQAFEMSSPQVVTCESFMTIYDRGGTDLYIMDKKGVKKEIGTSWPIIKACIASQGTVAVLVSENENYYVKLYDVNGKELASGEFFGEQKNIPVDIALSYDAKKLAVDMIDVSGGKTDSVISFYNFGSVGQNEIDYMVGSFDYPDVIIPQIEFTDNNRLVAFGDSKIILFSGTQKPEPDDEIALNQEIKSVFTSENYIGIIYNNDVQAESDTESTEESRHMEIYNTGGKHVLSKDFTMDYENVDFLGNGEICIRNATECQIYNTYGVKKFSYTFDTPLYDVISDGSQNGYIFIMEGTTEKVRLK